MRLQGEVIRIEHQGDEALVTVGNVRRLTAAEWRNGGPNIAFLIPLSAIRSYAVGRVVAIEATCR